MEPDDLRRERDRPDSGKGGGSARRLLPLRVERHPLGPRCYVFGQRVHEVAAGVALLVASTVLVAAHVHIGHHLVFGAFAIGAWLTAKDWPDLFPSKRNTRSWSAGVHRSPEDELARRRRFLPLIAGALTAGVGLLNIGSVLTPDLADRAHDVAHVSEDRLIVYAHALALSAGLALLVMAYYLARRRRRALETAIGLLVLIGVLNIVKGLGIAEALLSWALAGALLLGRDAFPVRQEEQRASVAALQAAAILAAAFALTLIAVVAGTHWATRPMNFSLALRETLALVSLSHEPVHFHRAFRWLHLGASGVAVGAMLGAAYVLFRPLAHTVALPGNSARMLAGELIRSHGSDTLSFFKLRGDQHYYFSSDGSAFVGYTVEAGVLLISGDPIGPPEALAPLLTEIGAFAETRGLRLGCVGASEPLTEHARKAGLKALYIGDEAIIDVGAFSLEGRPIRKVRQSVTRLRKSGYRDEVSELAKLDAQTLEELERVSDDWRAGAPERGFSMALDSLRGEHQQLSDSLVVFARDEHGTIQGFLHFVPCFGGRPAMSLSFMRRTRETPNGLTEFLVVAAIEAMRERGSEEISLNFAAFARYLREPAGRRERLLGKLIRTGDRFFQIESLYRFNAKFFPRWQPRYLLYEDVLVLPRTGLAAMWAEGQLPKPRLRAARPAPEDQRERIPA